MQAWAAGGNSGYWAFAVAMNTAMQAEQPQTTAAVSEGEASSVERDCCIPCLPKAGCIQVALKVDNSWFPAADTNSLVLHDYILASVHRNYQSRIHRHASGATIDTAGLPQRLHSFQVFRKVVLFDMEDKALEMSLAFFY